MATLDHLVLATGDVEATAAEIRRMTGIEASVGGAHPGLGTCNRLASLGSGRYLEIIGPDPAQQDHRGPRPFGVEPGMPARLATWAIAADGEAFDLLVGDEGWTDAITMSRAVPGRAEPLVWRLAMPVADPIDGLVPFAIDWGSSPHPSTTAARGLTLRLFSAVAPDIDALESVLDDLAVDVDSRPVVMGTGAPALSASVSGPAGTIHLGA